MYDICYHFYTVVVVVVHVAISVMLLRQYGSKISVCIAGVVASLFNSPRTVSSVYVGGCRVCSARVLARSRKIIRYTVGVHSWEWGELCVRMENMLSYLTKLANFVCS